MLQETMKTVEDAEAKAAATVAAAKEAGAALVADAQKQGEAIISDAGNQAKTGKATADDAARAAEEKLIAQSMKDAETEIEALKQTATAKESEAVKMIISELV